MPECEHTPSVPCYFLEHVDNTCTNCDRNGMHYEAKGRDVGRLVDQKQKQYGDSFHKCGDYFRLLFPDGIKPEQYDEILALARDFDKSMRIASGNQGEENAWKDKAGYALLAMKDEPLGFA